MLATSRNVFAELAALSTIRRTPFRSRHLRGRAARAPARGLRLLGTGSLASGACGWGVQLPTFAVTAATGGAACPAISTVSATRGSRRSPTRSAANFADGLELGASLCVYVDDHPVVDLWGGWADEARTRPWDRDTIACVFSSTKGLAAIALLMLVDRGIVDLDAPVATLLARVRGRAARTSSPSGTC